MALDKLISPLTEETFVREYLGREYFYKPRTSVAPFAHIFKKADIKKLLTFKNLNAFGFRVFRDGVPVPQDNFTVVSPRDHSARRISLYQIKREFKRGGTLIFERAHMYHSGLRKFCRELEISCGRRFKANLYVSPAHSDGFRPHYDGHDVFICQIAGLKHWKVSRHPTPHLSISEDGKGDFVDGDTIQYDTFSVSPGDVIYVPKGRVHAARTGAEMSVHVTIGMTA